MFFLISFDKFGVPWRHTVIFYTLKGPTHDLEISEENIRLVKKPIFKFFTKTPKVHSWKIDELSKFEIADSKVVLCGKLHWQTFDGEDFSFRFTTNEVMMKKIEKYLQKKVLKNHQTKHVA